MRGLSFFSRARPDLELRPRLDRDVACALIRHCASFFCHGGTCVRVGPLHAGAPLGAGGFLALAILLLLIFFVARVRALVQVHPCVRVGPLRTGAPLRAGELLCFFVF